MLTNPALPTLESALQQYAAITATHASLRGWKRLTHEKDVRDALAVLRAAERDYCAAHLNNGVAVTDAARVFLGGL